MSKIKIITDSTSDLNEEHYKALDADVLPLGVSFLDQHYIDRVDITTDEIYAKVKQYNNLPKTSAVNVQTMIDTFEKYLKEGIEIIFIPISSYLSSNYNNACIAATTLKETYGDHIRVVDSLSLSSGVGLQLFPIKDDIDRGLSLEEVYQNATKRTALVNAEFVVDTMEYLYKGGRCSGLSYFFGKNFHLHPVILVENGAMKVHKITRGKKIKGIDLQIEEFKKELAADNIELGNVFITHSGIKDDDQYMYDEITKLIDKKHVSITKAGSIIASHCGWGTIGLLYIKKH